MDNNYWKEKYADMHLRLTNKIAELEKENAEIKKALKTLAEGLNIRQQILQEIKEIAEKPKLFKDFSEIKTATEVEYDYAAICNELELRLHKVLELINKTEEE